jgi:ATP-dependent DNA helicase PIF1
MYGTESVFTTASTGTAAAQIRGTTVHSALGVGIAQQNVGILVAKALKNKWLVENLKKVKVWFIDETSMISADYLGKMDAVLKAVRESTLPFGGVQMCFVGDFFQLPPVKQELCFMSPAWEDAIDKIYILTLGFRQKEDQQWLDMLREIRIGKVSDETTRILNRCPKVPDPARPTPVKMFPDRNNADLENLQQQAKIQSPEVHFDAMDSFSTSFLRKISKSSPEQQQLDKDKLLKDTIDKHLVLKAGSRVICRKNLDVDRGIVNGASGTVLRFEYSSSTSSSSSALSRLPVVQFDNGIVLTMGYEKFEVTRGEEVEGTRTAIPLILGWSITIHRSQGMTLSNASVTLNDKVFEYHQVYVALSRVDKLENLILPAGFHPAQVKVHPQVVEFYAKHLKRANNDDDDESSDALYNVDVDNDEEAKPKKHKNKKICKE